MKGVFEWGAGNSSGSSIRTKIFSHSKTGRNGKEPGTSTYRGSIHSPYSESHTVGSDHSKVWNSSRNITITERRQSDSFIRPWSVLLLRNRTFVFALGIVITIIGRCKRDHKAWRKKNHKFPSHPRLPKSDLKYWFQKFLYVLNKIMIFDLSFQKLFWSCCAFVKIYSIICKLTRNKSRFFATL